MRNFLLVSIVGVAAFLRFYHLDTLPPSLEWDEVATGYDAYSLLKTGQDQYSRLLPLTMRSLDDYKPPLYTYLTAASIALFGWTDFAVRFPAAFLGVAAVATTYLMTFKMFQRQKVALLAMLFLAISPWHVNFSRLALETNSTIFFTTAGVLAFLKGFKNGKFLVAASLLFGLDLYLYHNARVFIPLIIVVLLFLYRREVLRQKKYALIAAVITGIFMVRLIPILLSVEGQMRFAGTSVFTEAVPLDIYRVRQQYAAWRAEDAALESSVIGRVFHSDKVFFLLLLLKNYLVHLDPTFWLFTDDTPRHHASAMGVLYFVDLPLVLIGMYFLFRERNRRAAILLTSWFLIAPIPAAVTRDVPHSLRTAIFLPTFQILISLAVVRLEFITGKRLKKFLYAILGTLYLAHVAFFLHQYFVHFAKDTSEYWQYGRKEAALFTQSVKDNFDRILVSPSLRHSYIFFLYHVRFDPQVYLQEGGTVSGGWGVEENHFDKFYFKSFDYERDRDQKTLFIGVPTQFPPDAPVLKKIYYLNGNEAIWIVAG